MLGIDVSKATLATTLLDERDGRPCWHQVVPNTAAGVHALLAQTAPSCPWVLEPTGAYSAQVARHAQAAGRTVLMAPPAGRRPSWPRCSPVPRPTGSTAPAWLGTLAR